MSTKNDVYIISAVRTPVGSFLGSLSGFEASDLGSIVIKEAVKRAGINQDDIDEVILGNVLQAGQGQNPARIAMIKAGLDETIPAMTVNKVCGSGLTTVSLASKIIKSGESDVIVCGGMESMSNAPYLDTKMRKGSKMGNVTMIDSMVNDGLWDIYNDYHMGITAENVAQKLGITREMQDEFAAKSQNKAEKAINDGKFKEEIIPVSIKQRKGDDIIFDTDEYIRSGATAEGLAKLRPAFKKDGTVTAGNASGINDGACALILASEKYVKDNNIEPLAKIVANGSKGVDPAYMGLGPVPSVKEALTKAGMNIEDIDLIEANEAFAAQALGVASELGMKEEKVNANGGAIAIGHPIGASGARILTTLIYEMKRENLRYGLATLCIGGGMGEALIVEML